MIAEIKLEAVEVAVVASSWRALCLGRSACANSVQRMPPGPGCDGSGKSCAGKNARPIVQAQLNLLIFTTKSILYIVTHEISSRFSTNAAFQKSDKD